MNAGKVFEKCFKESIPKEIYCLRLRDGTASWGNQENTRFQHYNPCDMVIHYKGFLFLTELKSHKGKSIPFTCLRESQKIELAKIKNRDLEKAIIIFNMRDLEETYIVDFTDIEKYLEDSKISKRKSFSLEFIREYGIVVPAIKKKVNFKYNVIESLDNYLRRF